MAPEAQKTRETMTLLDSTQVRERIASLAKKFAGIKFFDQDANYFVLNSPLPESSIADFESEHNVQLPDDYRQFLLEIGNGFVGPMPEVYPLGRIGNRPWLPGEVDLSGPFPHEEAWNLEPEYFEREKSRSDADEKETNKQWDVESELSYWGPSVIQGAIPIAELGCGQMLLLVVSGLQRGYLWNDSRVDHCGIEPATDANGTPFTFGSWLLESLEKAEQSKPVLKIKSNSQVSRRDWLLVLFLMTFGIVLGWFLASSKKKRIRSP